MGLLWRSWIKPFPPMSSDTIGVGAGIRGPIWQHLVHTGFRHKDLGKRSGPVIPNWHLFTKLQWWNQWCIGALISWRSVILVSEVETYGCKQCMLLQLSRTWLTLVALFSTLKRLQKWWIFVGKVCSFIRNWLDLTNFELMGDAPTKSSPNSTVLWSWASTFKRPWETPGSFSSNRYHKVFGVFGAGMSKSVLLMFGYLLLNPDSSWNLGYPSIIYSNTTVPQKSSNSRNTPYLWKWFFNVVYIQLHTYIYPNMDLRMCWLKWSLSSWIFTGWTCDCPGLNIATRTRTWWNRLVR